MKPASRRRRSVACSDETRRAEWACAVIGLGLTALLSLGTSCAAASNAPLTASDLQNLSYSGIYDEPVTLSEGEWQGEPFDSGGVMRPRVELVRDLRSSADMDGDGAPEAVVILVASSGGSGTYRFLALVGRGDGRPVNRATAPIGDRVQLRALRAGEGRIELELVEAGPRDAMCCPSQLATRVYVMEGERLRQRSHTVTGVLSPGALAGSVWVLTHFDGQAPAPKAPAITLELRDGRLVGSSGCNRYFTTPEPGDRPGTVTIGPIGTTRMACPEPIASLETRYLQALQRVSELGFVYGKLALGWSADGQRRALVFDRKADEAP